MVKFKDAMMDLARTGKILLVSLILCLPRLLYAIGPIDASVKSPSNRSPSEILSKMYQLRNQMEGFLDKKNFEFGKRSYENKVTETVQSPSLSKSNSEPAINSVEEDAAVSWLVEAIEKIQPKLKTILNSFCTYLLSCLDIQLRSTIWTWFQFLETPSVQRAHDFTRKFINAFLLRPLVASVKSENGRNVNAEVIDPSTEHFMSDQEPPVGGTKPYRLHEQIKLYRQGNSKSRPGFGYSQDPNYQPYEAYYESKHETKSKPSFKNRGAYRKGKGKYLKLTKGEASAGSSSQYVSKKQSEFTAKVHSFAQALDPFAVLAVLAFLTFLALLVQQLLRAFGVFQARRTNQQWRVGNEDDETFEQQWILSTLDKLTEAFSAKLEETERFSRSTYGWSDRLPKMTMGFEQGTIKGKRNNN